MFTIDVHISECLFYSLFRAHQKKIQSFELLFLCGKNPQVTGVVPAQRAINAEIVSTSWCCHDNTWRRGVEAINWVIADRINTDININLGPITSLRMNDWTHPILSARWQVDPGPCFRKTAIFSPKYRHVSFLIKHSVHKTFQSNLPHINIWRSLRYYLFYNRNQREGVEYCHGNIFEERPQNDW